MELEVARERTEKLMRQWGLDGWRLEFDNAPVRAGVCYSYRRVIALSKPITELNEWEGMVENTALHEIAHALADPKAGHGPQWKAMALKVGADPWRNYSPDMVVPPGTWQATCQCPGTTYHRQHRPHANRRYRCPRCRTDLEYRRVR